MKSIKIALLIVVVVLGGAVLVFAKQSGASIDKGKALFNDPALGTSGTSCNSCHPDGKGLENAGTKSNIAKTINACISKALKGKPLKVKSDKMQSLVLYIKSTGEKPSAPVKPVKKPAVGC